MTRLLFPLLVAVMLLASAASAQPGRKANGALFQRLEKLGLSSEQKSALKDAMRDHKKKMIDLRASAQKKRMDIADVMDKETPNRQTYEKLSKEMSDIQLQQRMLLFDMRQSLMNNLTPEQRKIWLESKGDAAGQFRGREGKGPGRRGEGPRDDDDDDED